MANIAKLPDGKHIALSKPDGWNGPYGPNGLRAKVVGNVAVLHGAGGERLAAVVDNGNFTVALTRLDPAMVPYVNRFLAGTDSVVIKIGRSRSRLAARMASSRSIPLARK